MLPAVILTVPVFLAATIFLASTILWIGCPHYDGKRHFRPWIGIVGYASSHMLLIVSSFPIIVFFAVFSGPIVGIGFVLGLWLAVLASGILCVQTLMALVKVRAASGTNSSIVGIALHIAYFAAIQGGFFLAVHLSRLFSQLLA